MQDQPTTTVPAHGPGGTRRKKDNRKLVRTGTPGVFKRVAPDGKVHDYAAIFVAGGRQRKKYARTLAEARALKRAAETDDDRGEFVPRTNLSMTEYLRTWIDEYQGNGRRGFRDGTRAEYRRLLDAYALEFFSPKLRLCEVKPLHLRKFIAWLADERIQGKRLSDSTIRNALNPVRAALATAQADGLIRHNPAVRLVIPKRERIEEDEHEAVKALSREQLAQLLSMAPTRYRLLLKVMASTGLRVSEAVGLRLKDVVLAGSRPEVRVRRAIVKRREEPPKTKYGRRNVALPHPLVLELRAHVATLSDRAPDALLFPSKRNTPLDPDTIRRDVLQALMQEIGASGLGFHALRHTYASMQLAAGVNVLQLSRALGHHSPAFTLATYTHLLPGDEAPALDLGEILAREGRGDSVSDRVAAELPAAVH